MIVDQVKTFKGVSVIITRTGELRLPDGYLYLLELISESVQLIFSDMVKMSSVHSKSTL